MNSIEKYIEHTLLRPDVKEEQLIKLFDEAKENNFLGVCINPMFVKKAKEYLKNTPVKIVTVVGFPLGASISEVKAFETKKAVEDGADEIDMVININAIKDRDFDTAQKDVESVVNAAHGKPVKVILETDLLTKEEIIEACNICVKAKAQFVKTSTGFVKGGIGATAENVKLMHDTVSTYGLLVKASGGVKTRENAIKMIEAGASRIGTSSGVEIVEG
jgi:deoxyribose-phosphate aldolase